jgi:hypothetical protein
VRPFWFGHPKGAECVRWQPETHCDPAELRQRQLFGDERKAWVTCRDALSHLDAKEIGRPLRIKPRDKHPPSELEAPAQTILTGTPRDSKGGAVLARPNWKDRKSGMDEPTRTIGTKRNARLEWPWDRPATGIVCDERLQPPGHNDSVWKARSGPNAIALSEKAASILQRLSRILGLCGQDQKRTIWYDRSSHAARIGASGGRIDQAVVRGVQARLH